MHGGKAESLNLVADHRRVRREWRPGLAYPIHMHAAQKAGATPEEIMEALNFVGSWIGVRRLLGLEAWRATFAPTSPRLTGWWS